MALPVFSHWSCGRTASVSLNNSVWHYTGSIANQRSLLSPGWTEFYWNLVINIWLTIRAANLSLTLSALAETMWNKAPHHKSLCLLA